MSFGGSILLIVIGAILAFAIDANNVGWVNIDAVGWIMMLGGVAGLVFSFWYWDRNRSTVITRRDDNLPPTL